MNGLLLLVILSSGCIRLLWIGVCAEEKGPPPIGDNYYENEMDDSDYDSASSGELTNDLSYSNTKSPGDDGVMLTSAEGYQVSVTEGDEGLGEQEYETVVGALHAADEQKKQDTEMEVETKGKSFMQWFVKPLLSHYFSIGADSEKRQEQTTNDNDEVISTKELVQPVLEVPPNTDSQNLVSCKSREFAEEEHNSIIMVNDSSLQTLLKTGKNQTNNSSSAEQSNREYAICQTLLLFAPWCPFSAQLAPHYNALVRVFPDLEVLAINAVNLNYWNARFGTVAVPNILLFHNGRFVAKFNSTTKELSSLTEFISNTTTLMPVEGVNLTEVDYEGPIPTTVERHTDYYLILSWLVILASIVWVWKRFVSLTANAYAYLADLFVHDHPHLD